MAERRLLEYQDGELLDSDNPALSDEETAFQNFRESLKAGEDMATLRVSRVPKSGITGHAANAKIVYCFSCPIDRYEFEELLDYIVDNYGGGIYRLIGTKKGKVGTAFNRLVEIAEPIKPRESAQGGGFGAVMETVAGLINQSQERTEALISRLQPPPHAPTPAPDPFALMERMATLFATLGVLGNKAPTGGDFASELDKMTKLKGLIEDFGDGGGDDGPRRGSNAYDLISKSLDTFGPVIMQGLSQQKTTAMKTLPSPAPSAQPQGNSMHALKPQIETLVRNAQKGIPAENMAHNVIAMTPEERLGDLRNFVGAADAVSKMAAIVPAVNAVRPWFDALRAHILNELQGEGPANDFPTEGLQESDSESNLTVTAPEDSET